ncbi:MAG: hypothetical protein ABR521_04305 [Gaiellaceae bacterium]
MTEEVLRTIYDPEVPESLEIVTAGMTSYCIQARVGAASFMQNGPATEIVPGSCGSP